MAGLARVDELPYLGLTLYDDGRFSFGHWYVQRSQRIVRAVR